MVLSVPKHTAVNAVMHTVWGFIYSDFCWLFYQMLGITNTQKYAALQKELQLCFVCRATELRSSGHIYDVFCMVLHSNLGQNTDCTD